MQESARDRWQTVERAIASSLPPRAAPTPVQPTLDLVAELPALAAFGQQTQYRQQILERRANMTGPLAAESSWAWNVRGPPQAPPAPEWAKNSRGPGISSSASVGMPAIQLQSIDVPPAVLTHAQHVADHTSVHDDLARARRQGAARDLANLMRGTTTGIERPTSTDAGNCCAICMETYVNPDRVSFLRCRHHFHTA